MFIPVCCPSHNYENHIRVVASVWEFCRLRDMALKLSLLEPWMQLDLCSSSARAKLSRGSWLTKRQSLVPTGGASTVTESKIISCLSVRVSHLNFSVNCKVWKKGCSYNEKSFKKSPKLQCCTLLLGSSLL